MFRTQAEAWGEKIREKEKIGTNKVTLMDYFLFSFKLCRRAKHGK